MKTLLFLVFLCMVLRGTTQSVGIKENGTLPHSGAILDLQSTNKGLLIPRLSTLQRLAMINLTPGLMVYDTDLNQFFYYSTVWQSMAAGSGWGLGGNAGITTNQFIGTTDAAALRFRSNNLERLRIETNGNLSILSDQQSLQFANATANTNVPMMHMFSSGFLNRDRMVLALSPTLNKWGLEYRDTTDAFFLRNATSRKFAFELGTGHMGIGVEDPSFPLDAVGRLRLQSDGNLSNSPGIWFANQPNTFDRVFLGMESADSTFGIYSQHLGKWAVQFEVMREPRMGIGNLYSATFNADVARAEIHVGHSNFGGSNDGVRIQNEGINERYWNLYTSNSTGMFEFYTNGVKRVTIDPVSGGYAIVSDEKLKRNIQPLAAEGIMGKLMQLKPSNYQYATMVGDEGGIIKSDRNYLGFIAQDVEKLFPSLVFKGGDDPAKDVYTMDYAGFGIIAIKGIQEQQFQITQQQAQITEQRQEIEELKKQVQQLMQRLDRDAAIVPAKLD